MNRSERGQDSRPSTTNSNTCKYMIYIDGNLAVLLSVVPSDEEKGRQMWRKYLEREDSRIGGKYTGKKYLLLLLPTFAGEVMGILFPRGPCFCLWLTKLRQEWVGKGRQAFSMLSMAWLSLPRSLCWAAEEFPDMYGLWLLLHRLRPLLGPLVAHCEGMLGGGWASASPSRRWVRRGPSALLSGLGEVVTTDLDLFSLQRGYPEVTLMDCMRLFTKEDILDGDEKPVSHSLVTAQPPSQCLAGEGPPSLTASGLKLFLAPFVLSFRHAAAAEPENVV